MLDRLVTLSEASTVSWSSRRPVSSWFVSSCCRSRCGIATGISTLGIAIITLVATQMRSATLSAVAEAIKCNTSLTPFDEPLRLRTTAGGEYTIPALPVRRMSPILRCRCGMRLTALTAMRADAAGLSERV